MWKSSVFATLLLASLLFFARNKDESLVVSHHAKRADSIVLNPLPLLAPSPQIQTSNAITYTFSGGRFGDNLLAYFHAKWIAYKHRLPFLYKPFPHSDRLALHERDSPLGSSFLFGVEATLIDEAQIQASASSTLFTIPFFPEPSFKNRNNPFAVDWEDPGFREEMIHCLTPKEPIALFPLPKDRKTVGVHVRRGGGFDSPAVHYEYPLKFPPDSYYIEQIERIANLYRNEPLYVFIMTDDPHPEIIAEKYRKALKNPRLEFDWRKGETGPDQNVLEDFFLIPQFDALILCDSNFSLVASKISNGSALIFPVNYAKKKGSVKITRVQLQISDEISSNRRRS